MAQYDTVANVVSEVSVQCGLGTVSDVFASTDANVVQMRELLKTVGRRLILRYRWLQCMLEHTFTTTPDTSYSLPTDFQSMVDQTGWNRTTDLPLDPLTPQAWQYVKAVDSASVFSTIIRPKNLTIEIHSPTAGQTVAFFYRSRYWVAVTGSTTPTKDAPTLNTDVVVLDNELIKAALKYQFLKDKGFPSDSAREDFLQVLTDCMAHNVNVAPELSLNARRYDALALPEGPSTGFGLDGLGGLF